MACCIPGDVVAGLRSECRACTLEWALAKGARIVVAHRDSRPKPIQWSGAANFRERESVKAASSFTQKAWGGTKEGQLCACTRVRRSPSAGDKRRMDRGGIGPEVSAEPPFDKLVGELKLPRVGTSIKMDIEGSRSAGA